MVVTSTVEPGGIVVSWAQPGTEGLVGVIRIMLRRDGAPADEPLIPLTTTGITEEERATYRGTLTIPEDAPAGTATYSVWWDRGDGSPPRRDPDVSIRIGVAPGPPPQPTYDLSTSVGQVRFETGDTDPEATYLTDQEIAYALAEENEVVLLAAARCCETIAARLAGDYDFQWENGDAGGSFKRSQARQAFADLAVRLRARAASSGAPWMAAGSRTAKDALSSNPDRVRGAFSRGQFTP